jgi:hypothetical protein
VTKSAVLLVSLAVALAMGSGYLLRELHGERTRVVVLQARVAELERADHAAIPSAEPVRPDEPLAETCAEVSHEPVQTPATVRTKPVAVGECTSPDVAELERQLADPQVRATQVARIRLGLERSYPDLATALNLQPDEVARLLDLLAKQEMDQRLNDMRANNLGRLADEDGATRRRQDAERRQQVEAERVALLGEAKFAEWHEYMNTLPARADLWELRTRLAETSYPLRSDQLTSMVAALAAEQQRHAAERTKLYNSTSNPTNSTPEETVKYYHERLNLIEQSLQRRHQLATAYLDTEQLKRYDEMLSFERRRAQIEHDEFVATNQWAQRERAGR